MFTPIKDEITLLIQDLQLLYGITQDEQSDIQNPSLCMKYEGMLEQLEYCIERVAVTSVNIDEIIENILKNASDGNYSAKMELVTDENILLMRKIEMLESENKTLTELLNKNNKLKTKVKEKLEETSGDKIRKSLKQKPIENLDDNDDDLEEGLDL